MYGFALEVGIDRSAAIDTAIRLEVTAILADQTVHACPSMDVEQRCSGVNEVSAKGHRSLMGVRSQSVVHF
ncbi:MAG: hypothetical protein JJU27_18285 [Gammaproteobacteria bacterium]|nr:hypothetical protein [Gammaproteobacteria bacterium]